MHIRVALVASTVVLITSVKTHSQDVGRGAILTGRSDDSRVEEFEAFTEACPAWDTETCDYRNELGSPSCQILGLDTLGVFGGNDYYLARYLLTSEFPDGEGSPWTCETDVVALLESNDPGEVHTVWRDATERTFEFIRDGRMAEHAGLTLFALLYCLNGTGGCSDYLLIRQNGRWEPLQRDETWSKVYEQLPGGYRAHKSPPLDIEALTWEQNIASPNDANCCPSGTIHLDLTITDGKLSVKRARVEAELSLE